MDRYDDDYEIECPECGTKFKVDCDTCGYGTDDGLCKWNMNNHDDPCTDNKYRWKPKKKDKITTKLYIVDGSDGIESYAFYGVCDSKKEAKKLIKDIKSKENYIGKYDDRWKINYFETEINKCIKED